MVEGSLDTTNLLLGIIAAVSVLEALVLAAVAIFAYRLYTRTLAKVEEIEERHVVPLVARVDALMARVDTLMSRAEPVIDGAQRVNKVVSAVDRARQAFGGFFNGRRSSSEAPEHTARAGAGSVIREDQHNGG